MKKRVLCLLMVLLMVISMAPISSNAATNGHSAQDAIAWVKSQVGKSLDYDGVYGAQCVDLIKYYYAYLGCASYAIGNGCDYATNALPAGWARYPGGQPKPGDILVYSGNTQNPYGHVAIYEADRVTYHQNIDGKQYVVCASYKYNGLSNPYWGVIRPDFTAAELKSSWDTLSVSNITENNAYINGRINFSQTVNSTAAGVRLYDSNGNRIASKDETINYNSTYVDVWYDIVSELGVTLTSGKTYSYQFYVTANGTDHWSVKKEFTTAHTHKYTTKVTAPTCTAQGYTTHTCTCGDSYKDTYTAALGHNYSYKTTTTPTTSAAGKITGTCSRCSGTTTVTLPKLNNTDYTYKVTKAATCTATGTATYTWKTTSYGAFTFTVTLPKIDHSYTKNITAPTCTEKGYTTYTCTCGDSYVADYVDALGHNYVDGKCTRCGAKDPAFDPATDAGKLVVSNVRARAGEEVTVSVSIEENPGVMVMALGIDYDKTKLKLVGFEDGIMTGWKVATNAVWIGADDVTANGVILKLKFKVLEDVEDGDVQVSLLFSEGDIANHNEEIIMPGVSNGTVTVYSHVPGDVTGDDKVNALDLVRLQRYLSGENVEIGGSCDITGDGKINALDLVRLQRYLSGEAVEIC